MLFRCALSMLLFALIPVNIHASITDILQSASKENNTAFVMVTEPGDSEAEKAKNIINGARKEIKNSIFIELDRADKENLSFVKKYQLSGVPVPLVLVFASNGVLAGGIPVNKTNHDKLISMVPSPKKAEVLKSIQSGQSVYVTASRKGMTGESDVFNACMDACRKMKDKSCCIQVDMDDAGESSFLKELKINPQAIQPVTVVINTQGQMTASFNGPVDITKLIQAATKKVKRGCCPPGSGKSCGPTKKTKKTK